MPMDKITLDRISTAHPLVFDELLCIYEEISQNVDTAFSKVRFTDVFRTFEQQAGLYAKGRTAPGKKVTWAKPGQSYHNYGLAVDIAILLDKNRDGRFESASWDTQADWNRNRLSDWLEVVSIFDAYGWQWGLFNSKGRRYDLPHFQKTFGYTTKQLMSLPKDGQGYPKILT